MHHTASSDRTLEKHEKILRTIEMDWLTLAPRQEKSGLMGQSESVTAEETSPSK